MHQACWNRWIEHAGPVCLICRYRPPAQAIIYYEQRPRRPDPYTLLFYIIAGIYVIFLMWRVHLPSSNKDEL